ncbi:hypothetical protein TrLO_g9311 [Triparma laevis f. longispina]|uniref:Macro domain-containing protein n=1 Tax=Triparma laevis f. longispina TaxID=1714387 RepID=A0A9W7FET5_9STRA|nr:hypothetical protein TrLO_g9311 [Triparma laevis f. longispina]
MIRLGKYAVAGRIQLWITPCAVTMPPPHSDIISVPTNERLCGTQFSHFPVGGPTPQQPYIGSQSDQSDSIVEPSWMLYQCESIDGVVTELNGVDKRDIDVPIIRGDARYPIKCEVGETLIVSASGGLKNVFEKGLALTVPPFWPGSATSEWRRLLNNSYMNTFNAVSEANARAITTPLIGAGARGAPVEHAAEVAASASAEFLSYDVSEMKILFACQDDDVADILDAALRECHEYE